MSNDLKVVSGGARGMKQFYWIYKWNYFTKMSLYAYMTWNVILYTYINIIFTLLYIYFTFTLQLLYIYKTLHYIYKMFT